jgi:hypothetical protein
VWQVGGAISVLVFLAACGPSTSPTLTVGATPEVTANETRADVPAPPATAAATATAASAATATATAVPTDTPTITPVPSPTAAPAARPTVPASSPGDGSEPYAVTGVAIDDTLNVRSGPGVEQPVVGTLAPYTMGVQLTGSSQDVDGARWVSIQYEALAGWVNGYYLARQVGSANEAIAARAVESIMALRNRDLRALAQLVHPDKGVRFSPYAYVRTGAEPPEDRDQVFRAEQVGGLLADPTVYGWGRYDGSGLPIELTSEAYYERFVYDVDFAHPQVVGYNEAIGHGNTINNIETAYPDGVFVEYHFQGFDPQFEGLDWRSLRLVFDQKGDTWYLVGIVHAEWTI